MTEAPLGDDPAVRIDQDVEETLERFDAAWQEGRKPLIQHYLPAGDADRFPGRTAAAGCWKS